MTCGVWGPKPGSESGGLLARAAAIRERLNRQAEAGKAAHLEAETDGPW